MTNSPLVSILIPCYNAELWVAEAIEERAGADWPNKEVIVVDDGSTDGSLDVIRSFGDRIRWETGTNRGGNCARNRLLELAAGDWLQYLDADDYMLPGKVAGQLCDASQSPSPDLIFSPITLEHWRDGKPSQSVLLEIPRPHDVWVLMARWQFPGTHAVLIRRSAVEEVGAWKPTQPCCQEHELFLRLLKANKQFVYSPRPGAIYRQWSNLTVCKRDPLLSMTKRLELLVAVENHLSESGQLTRPRQDAIAQSRLECARSIYGFDPQAAASVVVRMRDHHPSFRIPSAAAFPFAYRTAYRLLGFQGAEWVCARTRALRHASAANWLNARAPSAPLKEFPKVSILIPCYNAQAWIGQAIESALAQTWPNKEVIVVDDGSTDGSLDVIRSFGDRICRETGPNRGGNVARNRLLELSSGEWLQYLDADDYLLPDKIERQLVSDCGNPGTDLIYSPIKMEHWSGGINVRTEVVPLPTFCDAWVLLARWMLPNTSTSLWRRSTLIEVGGWKPDQSCCQEHELYFRLLKSGKRFARCSHAGAVYRQWSNETVCKRNPLLTYTKRLEILDRVEDHLSSADELISPRQDAIAHARLECARGIYRFERARSIAAAEYAIERHPTFRLPAAACFPFRYRLTYRLRGFEAAEQIAERTRKWRRSSRSMMAPR